MCQAKKGPSQISWLAEQTQGQLDLTYENY